MKNHSNNIQNPITDLLKNKSPNSFAGSYGNIYEYYISGEIEAGEEYTEWFHQIRNATVADIIKLHINSNGGDLFTAIQFIHVLAETPAQIHVHVEGACMSAATLLFLMGHEYEISPHAMFMIHNYSSATIGKGGEMYDNVVHERKWSENLLQDAYAGFLSQDEIKSVLDNKDIWMDSTEAIARLEKRQAYIENIAKMADRAEKSTRAKKRSSTKKKPTKKKSTGA